MDALLQHTSSVRMQGIVQSTTLETSPPKKQESLLPGLRRLNNRASNRVYKGP